LLKQVFRAIGPAPIRLAIETGGEYALPGSVPVATVRIPNLRTLAQMAVDPEIAFSEAFADGSVRVEGDLVRALEVVYDSLRSRGGYGWYGAWSNALLELFESNSLDGSRENIHRHYDLGNDFYRLWLDPQMVYTCAYFETPDATLEEAQRAKLDYVCRKLQLQPGESVVEAGCGWGAMALHMARHYGVRVQAFNISREQIEFARQRAKQEGLDGRVEYIEDDYRNIRGKHDVFVSIGMLEHVGRSQYARLGETVHRVLGDTGRGLIHSIGRSYRAPVSRWIRKRIFPGAYVPTLGEAMRILEPHGYAVWDVENLRPHYARTIEHWLARFDGARGVVSQMYDEQFERTWRLYLAGSIAGFRTGSLELFQILFAGPGCRHPFRETRASLYAPQAEDASSAGGRA